MTQATRDVAHSSSLDLSSQPVMSRGGTSQRFHPQGDARTLVAEVSPVVWYALNVGTRLGTRFGTLQTEFMSTQVITVHLKVAFTFPERTGDIVDLAELFFGARFRSTWGSLVYLKVAPRPPSNKM